MRFQQGVGERPTRTAISASDRLASSWMARRILRSVSSISRFASRQQVFVAPGPEYRKFPLYFRPILRRHKKYFYIEKLRSEEHTSELQTTMSISYDVF